MNNNFIKLISSAFFLLVSTSICAQIQEELNEQAKTKVKEVVAQMNDYISFMANPKKDTEMRHLYRKQALNLFIGKGYDYEEEGIEKEGVLMEVSSINRKRKSSKLTRIYFSGLIKMGYSAVEIKSTKCYDIKVSNLKKIADNEYVCTCEFEQTFRGFGDGYVYGPEVTRKRVKCYVTIEPIEQNKDGKSVEYKLRLGDTSVLETRKL